MIGPTSGTVREYKSCDGELFAIRITRLPIGGSNTALLLPKSTCIAMSSEKYNNIEV